MMDRELTERSDPAGGPIWVLVALWLAGVVTAVVGAMGDGGPEGGLCLAGLAVAGFFAVLALIILLIRTDKLSSAERFAAVAPFTLLLVGAGLFWVDHRLNREVPVIDSWLQFGD